MPPYETTTQPLDVGWVVHRINANLNQKPHERYRVLSGYPGEMPADLPVKIHVGRVYGMFETEGGPQQGLFGHVMDFDFYTKGVGGGTSVMMKLYRDPNALAIEVDGEEVYRWVQDDADLPSTTAAVIAEQVRQDVEWVDQVDLKPGDFVHDDGTIEREDEPLPLDDEDELLPDDDDDILVEDDDDIIEGELD